MGWLGCSILRLSAGDQPVSLLDQAAGGAFELVAGDKAASILTDPADFKVVSIAARCLADDIERVTGRKPGDRAKSAVIIGTIGKSALIDKLIASGKLDVSGVRGKWESHVTATVRDPLPGVSSGLVIAGSDRRGTAFGVFDLSETIGVSPWVWWADAAPQHRDALFLSSGSRVQASPAVKYRGIFINDEDWGLQPWAAKTFEPETKNIGPKTYAKVFELMLRLRLNYIWPAMHECTTEFGALPENAALADQYAIVAGASHCEPMLYNNVHWDVKANGPWNYGTNRNKIHSYWEDNVKSRGGKEAVWTIGIRGIHDAGMEGPKDLRDRISLLSTVIKDQRDLLTKHVAKEWDPVAQCFVPYKEVLPIYDAGLKVPDDVTLVWVDDNFGYIRRLGAPAERRRPGGAGVYWHLSYYGQPHSYTWINTTAPALIWEELHKAWENDARTMWVLNVGDIKPMEIGIDFFSRLAWNPEAWGADSQPRFLRAFAARQFGEKFAEPIAELLGEFYRLGTIRKPELMVREWALALPQEEADALQRDYGGLLGRTEKIAAALPVEARDAFTEMIGFPARVLGTTGLIFLADRKVRLDEEVAANESEIARLRADLEMAVKDFNTKVAGGKWNRMMPGLVTGKNLPHWNSQVRWPWGEKPPAPGTAPPHKPGPFGQHWRDGSSADRSSVKGAARWTPVPGLGTSARAMALKPAGLQSSWKETDSAAPTLEYDFQAVAGDAEALIDFLPVFRISPGMKLRVAVSVDNQAATIVEVPGSSGNEDERGQVRSDAVQDNYVRARVPLRGLAAGKHVFKIRAIDPGAVIDRVSLPSR